MLLYDGVCSQIMGALTGGAFLVAFALLLGASNVVIGVLAAIGPLTQILQIPAIFLVDRSGLRKVLVVGSSVLSRIAWLVVAALPWLVPADQRVTVLIVCLGFYFGLGAVSGCAFNSWMRDFIPEEIRGSYSGKRLAVATAVGAVLTLLAGFGVDLGNRAFDRDETLYSVLFMAGAASGFVGVFFLTRIPEPRMAAVRPEGLVSMLTEPFREPNYSKLLMFLGSWNFAVNLAAPFFVVYMIQRLQLPMGLVLGLSVLSQLVNVVFFRIWGHLADRFSNKSVLAVSGPLFVVSILLWPFLTMPEKHVLTIPLLVVIHVLAGVSTAGVMLCSGNIALKAAPRGKATAFLASNALVNGLAATVAPILAGLAADGFATQGLTLSLKWTSTQRGTTAFEVPAFDLRGLDFLFVISVIFGLYALHRLLAVREEGEVEEGIVVAELVAEVRKVVRHVSNVAGLRSLYSFPFPRLEQPTKQKRPQAPAPTHVGEGSEPHP